MKLISIICIAATFFTLSLHAQDKKQVEEFAIHTSAQCGMCKKRIEDAFLYEKGVKKAQLDLETNTILISYKSWKTDTLKLKQAVALLGYDANDLSADKKAYEALPGCCKKGGMH